ncbi:MAG: type IV secretory system conjugative DNA transfer family protein [Clostridia bacterium]|nr:type IV secretory system conjugative DNA transfer family protein [Clostridia bacterium]
MKENNYKYGRYINSNQETRWATTEEIQRAGTYVDLTAGRYPGAGLPLLSNGKEAYVDSKDTNTLIFGATGSKKTRLFCMPMLGIFAKAGESFVATDPKGELYAKTSGVMKANGYDIVVLNFRDIGNGDMWNPLALPYEFYHSGKKEEAISMLNDFVATIAEPQFKRTVDNFWPEMASAFALANLLLLMESGKPEEVNMASLAALCSMDSEDALQSLVNYMDKNTLAHMNYKGVFATPDNTKRCIFASLFGMVRIFNTQQNLTQMLSGNTIDIRNFGKRKTAVYIIVPDEKTTYHFLVTTFIKQVYETLITEAQKTQTRTLPVRVNFVLDEFCNIPKIPDMPSMISAARSRNMRFYLVAQSLHQLRGRYGEDADTIKGNCDNWVFLTSKELALLNEISELCGSVYTSDNRHRRLISVSELQRLDKEKGEALIMHARQYPIITEIADIDMYPMFKGYPAAAMKRFEFPSVKVFSAQKLYDDVMKRKCRIPFSKAGYMPERKRSSGSQSDMEKKFEDLFGPFEDDD